MIGLLLVLSITIFMTLKTMQHWQYLKISQNKFEGHDNYFSSAFSFDSRYIKDIFLILLPFFKKDPASESNSELKSIEKKVILYVRLIWGLIFLLIALNIFVFYVESKERPNDKCYAAYEFVEPKKAEWLVNVREPKKQLLEDGVYKQYHDNGNVFEVASFKDSVLHGKYDCFYEDGKQESKDNYHEGQPHGTQMLYYKNGNLMGKINYNHGLRHGESWLYYKNKQLFEKSTWFNGRPNGVVIVYKKNGKIKIEGEYDNGQVVRDFAAP